MRSLTLVALAALLTSYIFVETEAGGTGVCPLPSKVYSCSPKCVQDYECTHGKICCANSCNAKSCSEPGLGGQTGQGDKYSKGGGAGSYCNNVKCNSFETCKMDPATKRMKCMRA